MRIFQNVNMHTNNIQIIKRDHNIYKESNIYKVISPVHKPVLKIVLLIWYLLEHILSRKRGPTDRKRSKEVESA